jgi:hypothetical protein
MEYLYFKQALEIHIECNHVLIDQSTKSFLSDIIHEMLQIDTSRRPTAKELCEVFHTLLCSETVFSISQIGYEFNSRFHESSLLRRTSTTGTILSIALSNKRDNDPSVGKDNTVGTIILLRLTLVKVQLRNRGESLLSQWFIFRQQGFTARGPYLRRLRVPRKSIRTSRNAILLCSFEADITALVEKHLLDNFRQRVFQSKLPGTTPCLYSHICGTT